MQIIPIINHKAIKFICISIDNKFDKHLCDIIILGIFCVHIDYNMGYINSDTK